MGKFHQIDFHCCKHQSLSVYNYNSLVIPLINVSGKISPSKIWEHLQTDQIIICIGPNLLCSFLSISYAFEQCNPLCQYYAHSYSYLLYSHTATILFVLNVYNYQLTWIESNSSFPTCTLFLQISYISIVRVQLFML